MVRLKLLLLVLMALTLAGCAKRKGPIHRCVDKTFTPSQKTQVRDVYADWNDAGQKRVGYDLIIDDGDCEDADGFQIDDLNDRRHLVYNATKNEAFYRIQKANAGNHGDTEGWGTDGDAAIFTFETYTADACPDPTEPCPDVGYDNFKFWALTAHEIGHNLGLAHVSDEWSVMNEQAASRVVSTISETDIWALCQWYDCI